jgi:hypothetical protein
MSNLLYNNAKHVKRLGGIFCYEKVEFHHEPWAGTSIHLT